MINSTQPVGATPDGTASVSDVAVPLYVDLDGTLVRTDLLHESVLEAVKRRPLHLLLLPLWLLKGKAYLKRRVAQAVDLDAATLPYHPEFLDFLTRQRAQGRTLHLATASDQKPAQRVAAHLGLFASVLASDGSTNLSARNKLDAIRASCGGLPFDYAGNSSDDLAIWPHARAAILVDAPAGVADEARRVATVDHVFVQAAGGLRAVANAMRMHQWVKNLLLFAPLVAAHAWNTGVVAFMQAGLAFIAFCLCASGTYIINDLLDIQADRTHPQKRFRPFAAGDIAIINGVLLSAGLLVLAGVVAMTLPAAFMASLAAYLVLTLAYSLFLKRVVLVDVLVLAGLYTLRVIAGAAAIDVTPSFWLLAVSMFLFFSLALLKRCSELRMLLDASRPSATGRDYNVSDLGYLHGMGAASGYLAVLVLALFINSPDTAAHYSRPMVLWLLCPIALYWISRLWLKTGRGEMHHDPVVYSIRDRGSRYMIVAGLLVILLAS